MRKTLDLFPDDRNTSPQPRNKARGKVLKVFIDGASRGNPGPAGIGVVIKDESNTILLEVGRMIGSATNNVAEYRAFLTALRKANDFLPDGVEVFSDSELLVRQIRGDYRVKHPELQKLFRKAQTLIAQFSHFTISHISREMNQEADRLASRAARQPVRNQAR